MSDIEYRVENKYIVSDLDIMNLTKRLCMVMQPDVHQQGGCYEIRSVYFDDICDSCMDENEAGIDSRKKFRIRIYDPASDVINLEIKEKQNGLTKKTSCRLLRNEYEDIIQDGRELILGEREPLNQLLLKMRCVKMRPKIVIAYERTAYVHPTGNVRVTFDRNIMASKDCSTFFEKRVSGLIPILPIGMHVLEVKYDEMLPDMIAKQLEIGKLRQTSFSKYYLGRMAINGQFPFGL